MTARDNQDLLGKTIKGYSIGKMRSVLTLELEDGSNERLIFEGD